MASGTVKWYDPSKGFGFITPDEGGRDLYFQNLNIENSEETLASGQRVSFELSMGRKGPEAIHIRAL